MKRSNWILALALLALAAVPALPGPRPALADEKPYRVVFDLTSRDSLDQKAVMRWIREVSAASPDVQAAGDIL